MEPVTGTKTKKSRNRMYNFLVNESNQANLAGISNTSPVQLNSLFVFVSPYYIEKFNLKDFNLDITMGEHGVAWIDGRAFECVEIKPGVSVLGISVKE